MVYFLLYRVGQMFRQFELESSGWLESASLIPGVECVPTQALYKRGRSLKSYYFPMVDGGCG